MALALHDKILDVYKKHQTPMSRDTERSLTTASKDSANHTD